MGQNLSKKMKRMGRWDPKWTVPYQSSLTVGTTFKSLTSSGKLLKQNTDLPIQLQRSGRSNFKTPRFMLANEASVSHSKRTVSWLEVKRRPPTMSTNWSLVRGCTRHSWTTQRRHSLRTFLELQGKSTYIKTVKN